LPCPDWSAVESGGFAPLKAGDRVRISARDPGKNGSIEVVIE